MLEVVPHKAKSEFPRRLYVLDVSRGLAALAVVLWHWQHFGYEGTSQSANFARSEQPFYGVLRLFYEHGAMGVQYFFLLSGFVFFWLYRDPMRSGLVSAKQFVVQRFSRLYPLHLATLIIVAMLQLLYVGRTGAPYVYPFNDGYHLLLNLLFASHWGFQKGWSFNAPSWSVSVEIVLYIFFFVFACRAPRGIVFSLAGSVLAFLLYFRLSHSDLLLGLAGFLMGGAVFYFAESVSTCQVALKRALYGTALGAWLLVLFSVYVYDLIPFIAGLGDIGNILLTFFPLYIVFPLTIGSLAMLEADHAFSAKSMAWMGDLTYSSYLLHFPLQMVCALLVSGGLLAADFYKSPIALAAFFGVLILASRFTYHHFEMPLQRVMRRRWLPSSGRFVSPSQQAH